MSATKYTYSISTDFPNHKVNSAALIFEISSSAIVTAPDHVDTEGDVCDIWMKAALSEGDETLLDAVVAAHMGASLESCAHFALSSPSTADGTPVFLPCAFPSGIFLYVSSAGDDITNQVRGAGALLVFKSETEEDIVKYAQFMDPAYEADAIVQYSGADHNGTNSDYLTIEVIAPASVVVANGTNTGNCNVVNHVIVPAAGDGAYDINLETAAIPVPAKDAEDKPNGYWDYAFTFIGKGAITPNVGGTGGYHLLDVEQTLLRHGNKCVLLGAGNICVSMLPIEPKAVLPHWKGKVTVHNYGHTGLKVAVTLKVGRKVTA